jgi:polar amino acid transport system substrate-binding protein
MITTRYSAFFLLFLDNLLSRILHVWLDLSSQTKTLNSTIALVLALIVLPTITLAAVASTIVVDVRHRPPEMVVEGYSASGPLVDIILEAAKAVGLNVRLQLRQFHASYADLKAGKIDVLPRTLCTAQRSKEIDFIGPIGFQEKVIRFLVKPGNEATIETFADLKRLKVGVKLGTHYFDELNNATDIQKVESYDDTNMVLMFDRGRFDTMAVLDQKAVIEALATAGIHQFGFAHYSKRIVIGNYYGIRAGSPYKAALQAQLERMVASGRVEEIYTSHSVPPPSFQWQASECLPQPASPPVIEDFDR